MIRELIEVDVILPPFDGVNVKIHPQGTKQVDVTVLPSNSVQVEVNTPPLGTVNITGLPGQTGPAGPEGPPGPEGPEGPAGSGATSYTHAQNTASATWFINHNLGFVPNVMVVDSAGNEVLGDVTVVDLNNIRVVFSAAFGGIAYLS